MTERIGTRIANLCFKNAYLFDKRVNIAMQSGNQAPKKDLAPPTKSTESKNKHKMKKADSLTILTIGILFSQSSLFGQTLLNGSFEITSGNCEYNLPNAQFNSMMDSCYAFGNNEQIDIIKSNCGFGAAQQGDCFIGLAVDISNTLTDALSLKLSAPLIGGKRYMLNFYNRKDADYNTNLLEVGYSTNSLTFGTVIDTANLPSTAWGHVSFLFTPVVNSQFITIRTIAGSYGWNFVDNLTVSSLTGMDEIDNNHIIQICPNPSKGVFQLTGGDMKEAIGTIEIYNTHGEKVFQSTTLNPQQTIDLSAQPKGVYIVKIDKNQTIGTKKTVIQ